MKNRYFQCNTVNVLKALRKLNRKLLRHSDYFCFLQKIY
jgi:hypothetical protein